VNACGVLVIAQRCIWAFIAGMAKLPSSSMPCV
jgi:hypothetical protein